MSCVNIPIVTANSALFNIFPLGIIREAKDWEKILWQSTNIVKFFFESMASSKRRPAITYILMLYETLLHIGSTNQTTPRAHRKRRLNRTIHHPKPQVNLKCIAKDKNFLPQTNHVLYKTESEHCYYFLINTQPFSNMISVSMIRIWKLNHFKIRS